MPVEFRAGLPFLSPTPTKLMEGAGVFVAREAGGIGPRIVAASPLAPSRRIAPQLDKRAGVQQMAGHSSLAVTLWFG